MVSELSCAPLVNSRFRFVSSTFKYHVQSPNSMALLGLNYCSPFIRVLDIFSFNFPSKCGPSPLLSLCICSLFSFNCHFNCAIYLVPSFDCVLLSLFDFLRDADKFGFTHIPTLLHAIPPLSISNRSSTLCGCSYVLPIRSSLKFFNSRYLLR